MLKLINEKWFFYPAQRKKARLKLFCFPYAGGTPHIFRNWANHLPEDIEVIALRLPGRDSRIKEKAYSDWSELLDALEDALLSCIDIPFAFFGHSFGARLAFELTKRFHAKGFALPTCLFISGCRCPHIPSPQPFLHELPQAEFFERVFSMNGISAEILSNQKLMEMFEPTMRADMKLSELWENSAQQINVPIVAFSGLNDSIDPPSNMRGWENYTQAQFSFYTFSGDHFFLHTNEKNLLGTLSTLIQHQFATMTNLFLSLSLNQRAILSAYQKSPENMVQYSACSTILHKDLNIEALKQAWQQLSERHYSLRTTYINYGEASKQIIHSYSIFELKVINAENWKEKFLREQLLAELKKPFNLEQGPLLRINLYYRRAMPIQQIIMHRIAGDARSIDILLSELNFNYIMECAAEKKEFISANNNLFTVQQNNYFAAYTNFLNDQEKLLTSKEGNNHLAFWNKQLSNQHTLLTLPINKKKISRKFQPCSYTVELEKNKILQLNALAISQKSTIFNLMLAIFQSLLFRYAGREEFLIGGLMSGRSEWIELQNAVGTFANEVVFKADLTGSPSFQELLCRVNSDVEQAQAHQNYPVSLSLNTNFQVSFLWENHQYFSQQVDFGTTESAHSDISLLVKPYQLVGRQGRLSDITLVAIEFGGKIILDWKYDAKLYSSAIIKQMAHHYFILLDQILKDVTKKISNLSLLSNRELHKILVQWNKTQTAYPDNKTIHQLFEEQVIASPEAVAVIYKDQQLTYHELNQQANQLAHYLVKLGVKIGDLIGICIERSFDMVISLLAILKAGGVYLPLDVTYPQERLRLMLSDAGVTVLITKSHFSNNFSSFANTKLALLDKLQKVIAKESVENLDTPVKIDNLAYVNYTSGSTGRPKGVAIFHRGVIRLLFGVDYVRLDSAKTFLQLSPIAFDAATFEIWGALLHGAQCVIFEEKLPTIQSLRNILKKYKISTLFLTTALFNTIIDEAPDILLEVQQILTGGEAHSVAHMKKALSKLPATEIISVYGPTENTTFTTYYPVKKLTKQSLTIPIGQPISNTETYVLDENLQLVPVGVLGELYVGGAGLAQGYLHQPNLTQEKFIKNLSFISPEKCLYRTGDLVRYMPDGNLDFVGRTDNQTKIHGFRIELGEIEALLTKYPKIKQCAVFVQNKSHDNKKLIAYLVSKKEKPTDEQLITYLKEKLPTYMIPSSFFWLDEFPITPNYKIDRKKLINLQNSTED
jgi:amino acid adenylation domain-containing protein